MLSVFDDRSFFEAERAGKRMQDLGSREVRRSR
jgi:hypothetical protein